MFHRSPSLAWSSLVGSPMLIRTCRRRSPRQKVRPRQRPQLRVRQQVRQRRRQRRRQRDDPESLLLRRPSQKERQATRQLRWMMILLIKSRMLRCIQPPQSAEPPKVRQSRRAGLRGKNENKARKSQGSGKKVSKDATDMNQPKKPRASKGQAISFGRRDPPKGERLKAEWVAIRDAYRATLNHLVPVTKHEDNSGLMVLKCFHKFPTKIHIT